jgi:hypothetical protein
VSERLVFYAVLGVCACGALLAAGAVLYAARRAEREEERWR